VGATWIFTEKRQRTTVTTYRDYVRPTMTPSEGRGKVYLRFENLAKAAGGPALGPCPYAIFSFELRELALTKNLQPRTRLLTRDAF